MRPHIHRLLPVIFGKQIGCRRFSVYGIHRRPAFPPGSITSIDIQLLKGVLTP